MIANVALLGATWAAIRPEAVPQQESPPSELDVQAYQLDRAKAAEQKPDPQAAEQKDPDNTKMSPGAIPLSVAQPSPAKPTKALVETGVATQKLRANPANISPTIATKTAPVKLNPSDRPEPTVAAGIPSGQPVPETKAIPEQFQLLEAKADAARTEPPQGRKFAAMQPQADAILPPAEPDQVFVPSSSTKSTPVPVGRQEALSIKAALAFSGGNEGDVDPVSLAAFQSFVRPGDLPVSDASLRDGVSALLAQVPCSRLQVGFDPDSATLQVNGHIPEGDLRAPVLAALRDKMGADIAVSDNILILPRPQCGALSGIASVGLPQSTDQITNPLLIGADAHVRVLNFVKDDRLFFDLTAPDYDAYVYVDYFDAGGNVLHLAPNDQVPLRLAKAESAFRVGAQEAGDGGLQMFIGPPYGQEIAVAFAASKPIYDSLRPLIEPAPEYLAWLQNKISEARANDPDFKGEWVYFFVTTQAK